MGKVIRIIILSLIMLTIFCDSFVEYYDGDTWREATQRQKANLMQGYFLGMRYMAECIITMHPEVEDTINRYGLWDVECGEVILGLDLFYSNEKNRSIPLYVAPYFTKNLKEGL